MLSISSIERILLRPYLQRHKRGRPLLAILRFKHKQSKLNPEAKQTNTEKEHKNPSSSTRLTNVYGLVLTSINQNKPNDNSRVIEVPGKLFCSFTCVQIYLESNGVILKTGILSVLEKVSIKLCSRWERYLKAICKRKEQASRSLVVYTASPSSVEKFANKLGITNYKIWRFSTNTVPMVSCR